MLPNDIFHGTKGRDPLFSCVGSVQGDSEIAVADRGDE
jgi:hypothetical protein